MSNQSAFSKYASQPQSGVWTQAEQFSLKLKKDPHSTASLLIILVVHDQSQFVNLSSFYQSVYLRLQTYGQGFDVTKVDAFVSGLIKIIQEIKTDASPSQIEVCLSFIYDNKVIVGGFGGSTISLVRNNEIGKILDTSQGVVAAEGQLKDNDLLLLASEAFYKTVPYAYLKKILFDRLSPVSVDTLTSELVVSFQKQTEVGGLGFIITRHTPESFTDKNKKSHKKWWQPILANLPLMNRRVANQPKTSQVYVKQNQAEKKRQRMSIMIVLSILLVLTISVTIGWWQRQQAQLRTAFESAYQPIVSMVEEAEATKELNIIRSRTLIEQAKSSLIDQKVAFENNPTYYQQFQELETQIDELHQQISGEVSIELETFMNVSFIKDSFIGELLGKASDRLVIFDTSADELVTLGVENKDPSLVVEAESLSGTRLVSGDESSVYALADQGIVRVDVSNQTAEVVIEPSSEWQDIVGFAAFAGNVYLLDAQLGEIWRYRGVADDDFVRQRWLAPGVSPDFSQAVDMVIDGDIWVLDTDGVVRQYSRGVGQTIEWLGLTESFNADALGVSEEFILVLDTANRRVLQFDKEGIYRRQYHWQNSEVITDMVVIDNQILLMAGSTILGIPIE